LTRTFSRRLVGSEALAATRASIRILKGPGVTFRGYHSSASLCAVRR
jgi:hypothetical protein